MNATSHEYHPALARIVARFYEDEAFRFAVLSHPDENLAGFQLDDCERQALLSVARDWDRLPALIKAEVEIRFPI
jgi:hypothetical protein